ncbi:hypothetical protein [Haloarchaeobius sp. DFWS5]|uniref:hypothetical protein n=1 Tax=Haloarchaeobius sp. DFWS5 TaxID=3446114 RepID=UPI003EB80286
MGVLRSLKLLGGLCSVTVVETVTLGVWLGLTLGMPTWALDRLPASAPRPTVLAAVVLGCGLLLAGVLTDVLVNGFRLRLPVHRIGLLVAFQGVLLTAWVFVAQYVGGIRGVALAGATLALVSVLLHTVSVNVHAQRGLFDRLFRSGAVGVGLAETVGASVLLAFVTEPALALTKVPVAVQARIPALVLDYPAVIGVVVLSVALLFAHAMAVRLAIRSSRARMTVREAVIEQLEWA